MIFDIALWNPNNGPTWEYRISSPDLKRYAYGNDVASLKTALAGIHAAVALAVNDSLPADVAIADTLDEVGARR